jgi:hypothetical protein
MWFLLDQPHELPALKRWTRGLKAVADVGDSAIVQAAQPIYVGRAVFIGMADPIPPQLLAVVVRGEHDRVSLVVDRFEAKVVEIARKLDAATTACGDDWRRFLDQTLGGDLGFFEPLSRALGMAARSDDSEAVVVALMLALLRSEPTPCASGSTTPGGSQTASGASARWTATREATARPPLLNSTRTGSAHERHEWPGPRGDRCSYARHPRRAD